MAKVTLADKEEEKMEEVNAELLDPFDDGPSEEEENVSISIESLDPAEILWDGGPTAGDVVNWKKQYGDVYITNVTLDKHVVWRTLKRSEYKAIVRQIEEPLSEGKLSQTEANMLSEELTCQVCILFPKYTTKDFDGEMAGLPSILSQQINEASGFSTIAVRQL